jgi:hypothetical protein
MTKAHRQNKGLQQRLLKAEKALASLASKPGQDIQVLQEKVDRILKHHRVSDYLNVTITKQIRYPKVYQGSGRPSPERSFRRVRQTTLTTPSRTSTREGLNQLLFNLNGAIAYSLYCVAADKASGLSK